MTQIGLGPTKKPRRVSVGDMRITLLDGGELWLDGGAMFGIIPKPLWSKKVEADDANRIPLSMTCFLLESGGKRVLVETGSGTIGKYDEKERDIFRFADYWIEDSLHAVGVEPASIDFVILTHLHFDHAGGGTKPDGKGNYVPTFPNARYVVQRGEWEDAVSGHAVMTGTYREENLAPLERAGVLSLVSGDAEIVPGVSVTPLPGHTRWQQGVKFESADRRAILPADLMPTSAHVGLRYNMAYDLLPHENMTNKGRLLQESVEKEVTLLLGQDPFNTSWNVRRRDRDRFTLESAPVERDH
ncbi:MAG: MBL fold metallo-hydrolase [Planctomycetota bacterium]|nr:MBL fold metallo-hydrolase [Planctomycetota bacterium]MCZ6816152.1 MBL fold metallo-hydrolase [Planctomycetota bacterium]